MGKKSSKTKTTTEPWKPAQGDILGAIGTVRDVVGSNQGNLQNLSSQIGSYLPGLAEKAFGDNTLLNNANSYATDVLGGKYLNANPYLDAQIGATANDVSDRVNALFAKSGASLGTQHAGVLAKELANAENSMRYGNYAQERQNQQGAASLVPSLNSAQYAGVAPYLGAATTAGTLPYAGIGNLNSIIGLAGGSGQGSQTQPGGWGSALLGAASAALPFILSEREAKTDIEAIGEWGNTGLTKYRFRYKNDPDKQMQIGVMADEVAEKMPHAIGPRLANGYRTVNYAKLGAAA